MGFQYSSAVKIILFLILLFHLGALLVKVVTVSDGESLAAFEVFSFSLDAGFPFYGLMCVLAISVQFQDSSIALSMTRRPNRNHLYLREITSSALLVLGVAALISIVFFCVVLLLTHVSSKIAAEPGFYVESMQFIGLFCLAVFVLALSSSALSFALRSTAGSVIAYVFFLWILPVAGASLSFYDAKLGEFVVALSPASILSELISAQFAILPLMGGIAWVAVALAIGRFRFERYTP